jgi:hypothetical protein
MKITIADEQGNSIQNTNNKIELKLVNETRYRVLGTIDSVNRVFRVRRNKKKHLHRVSKSYGFNAHIIENAKLFDAILLTDDDGKYLIPLSVVKTKGKYLFFKQEGFERQIFLSLDEINLYKI